MKWPKALFLFLSVLVLAAWTNPSSAIEPIPQKDGFSGVAGVGASYLDFKSNEIAKVAGGEVSEKRTGSLSNEPDSKSSALPALKLDLRYTLGGSQTQFFLANELFDLVKLDSFLELGVRQQFSDKSILAAGVVFSGMVKVYQNPYQVNVDRNDTDRKATGLRVVYDKIMGSGLALEAMYRKIDIDDEKSGTGLGLTPSQIALLDRNGKEMSLGAQYAFALGDGHFITPSFTYINSDLDGDAVSNSRYQFEAAYLYDTKAYNFGLNLLFATASYDATNPVFDKEQEDTVFGGFAFGTYKNLADVQGMDLVAKVGYAATDADIDFLNSQATIAGLTLQYRF